MVPQTLGYRTLDQFVGVTVFVDNFSIFTFVYIIQSINTKETMSAKAAFERKTQEYGVKIQNYCANNCRFADNAFKLDCKNQK